MITGTASCKHRADAQEKQRLAEHLHATHHVQGPLGITGYLCTVGQRVLKCPWVGTPLPDTPCHHRRLLSSPLTVTQCAGHDGSALSGLLFFSAIVHMPFWTARNRTGLRSPYSPEATSITVEKDRTPVRC